MLLFKKALAVSESDNSIEQRESIPGCRFTAPPDERFHIPQKDSKVKSESQVFTENFL